MNSLADYYCYNVVDIFEVGKSVKTGPIKFTEKYRAGWYSLRRIWNENIVKIQTYNEDASAVKYLHLPEEDDFCFDLTEGYNGPFWVLRCDDGLPYLLHWIQSHKENLKVPPNFVCFRGLLSVIMMTPLEKVNYWCFHAVLYEGTIYMIDKTTRRQGKEERRSNYQRKASFGGYRFEEYISSEKPDEAPRRELGLSGLNYDQCNVVMKSLLRSHSFVYAAEVDCVIPGDTMDCVEIKTTKEIDSRRQEETFRDYKMIKWWSQSYLADVNKIVCGFRDKAFNVRRIETYSIDTLCKTQISNTCLNFLDSFMMFVKQCVTRENATYEFYWTPFNNEVHCSLHLKGNTILPHWYCEPS